MNRICQLMCSGEWRQLIPLIESSPNALTKAFDFFGDPVPMGEGYGVLHRIAWHCNSSAYVLWRVLSVFDGDLDVFMGIKNHKGESALETARRRENVEMFKCLELVREGGIRKLEQVYEKHIQEQSKVYEILDRNWSHSIGENNCSITVIGIGGATRSGKSSLARSLCSYFKSPVPLICQDRFLRWPFPKRNLGGVEYDDFEDPAVHDYSSLSREIRNSVLEARFLSFSRGVLSAVVVVEGFLLFHQNKDAVTSGIIELLDVMIYLEVSKKTCKTRRMNSTVVSEEYFEMVLWPSFLKYGKLPEQFRERTLVLDADQKGKDEVLQKSIDHIEHVKS